MPPSRYRLTLHPVWNVVRATLPPRIEARCAIVTRVTAGFSGWTHGVRVNSASRFLLRTVLLCFPFWVCSVEAQHKLKDQDCLTCHGDSTLTEDVNGKPQSLFVDAGKLKHSVHGSMFACVDCHTDVKSLAHDAPPKKIECAQCHADAQDAWAHSTHAKLTAAAKDGAKAWVDPDGYKKWITGRKEAFEAGVNNEKAASKTDEKR